MTITINNTDYKVGGGGGGGGDKYGDHGGSSGFFGAGGYGNGSQVAGANGTGGGGAGSNTNTNNGGAGGDGLVVISYAAINPIFDDGNHGNNTTSDGTTVTHTFKAAGTYSLTPIGLVG